MEDLKKIKSEFREYTPVLVPLVILMVLLIVFIRFLAPATLNIKDRFDKLQEDGKVVEKLERKLSILDEFTDEELVGLINRSQVLIPTGRNVSALLLSLKSIEDQSGVSAGKFALTQESGDKNISGNPGVDFSVDVASDKHSLFSYLSKIGGGSWRIIVLDSLTYTATGKDEDGIYELEIGGSAVYLPFIKTIGKVSDELPELSRKQVEIIDSFSHIDEFLVGEVEAEIEPIEKRPNPFVP